MKKHYNTLGLNQGASQEEIQTAYERLSKELDPKKNDHQEFFIEEYKKVQEAYKALRNSSILATEKGAKSTKNIESTKPISPKENSSNTNKKRKKTAKWFLVFIVILVTIVGIIGYTLLQPEKFLKKDTIVVVGVTKNKRDLKPITGVIKGYGAYEEGLKTGFHNQWNSKGQKIAQGIYKKGLKNGLWQYFYDNGQLKKEINYKNNLKEGFFKFWNSKSVLVAERNYSSDSLVGNNTSWFDNGQLKQIADYENDFTQIYDENGNLINEGSFVKIASQWDSQTYQNNRSSLSLVPLEPNVKWRYKTGDVVTSSPSVSGGMVFVGSWDNYIYALDQYTGALQWRYETGDDVI